MLPLTPEQLVARFLTFYESQVACGRTKQKTVDYYRHQLTKWLVSLPAAIALPDLKPLHVSNGSESWHDVQSVQRLFNWAEDLGFISVNPFRKVKRPSLGRRERVLTRSELAKLLLALSRPHRRFFVTMRRTLSRPGEIRDLVWSDYEPSAGLLTLKQFKAKAKRKDGLTIRHLPLDSFLRRMFDRWRTRRSPSPDDPIFTGRRGRPYKKDAITLAITRAVKRGGLSNDHERIVPYTIRHTAATYATKNGIRDRTLATLMGHTNTRTTARYQHLEAAELGSAIEAATSRPERKIKP